MLRKSEVETVVAPSPDDVGVKHQKSRCYIKFVKWLVRKNRALSMSKNDDELNEFIDEVTRIHRRSKTGTLVNTRPSFTVNCEKNTVR
jgi:hypothetical protein